MAMKIVISVDKFEVNETKSKKTKLWEMAFTIDIDERPTQYIPITILSTELNKSSNEQAMRLAIARVLPNIIGAAYAEKETSSETDFFDILEKSLIAPDTESKDNV